ncbi:MAG: alpha/beta hydrolase [Candidatus Omnitrophica bacterium]|nr:alpha/beta hydrolase [Candidatus Omnitrophota bacterium]
MKYILNKKLLIPGVLFICAASLFISGIHYSNIIIFPERHNLSDIPQDWEISNNKPEDYNLEYENVSFFTTDNIILRGWYIPGGKDNHSAVLLAHGYGTNRVKVLKYAPFLQQAGYNVLLFDFRGHGESEGRYCSIGYHERNDIHAAVKYLKAVKKMDKIGVLADSMGAVASILAMAENNDIDAGVFEGAFSSLKELLIYRGETDYSLSRYPLTELAIWLTEYRLKYDIAKVRPVDVVQRIAPRAVFFIHGDKDREVLPEDSKALYSRASQPKEFWMVSNMAHTSAFSIHPAEFNRRILAFFNQYINWERYTADGFLKDKN